MKKHKSIIRAVLPVVVLLGTVLLFVMMMEANRQRIEEHNARYVRDFATQKANRIDGLFSNVEESINVIALLYGTTMDSPEVDMDILREIAQGSSLFYSLNFVDAQGVSHTSGGTEYNVSDRDYFQKGMQGESGMDVVLDSRGREGAVAIFYAPLRYEGEIVGVLTGMYREQELRDIVTTPFFDRDTPAYLCLTNGDVFSSSLPGNTMKNIIQESGMLGEIDEDQQELIAHSIEERGSTSFTYQVDGSTMMAYIQSMPDHDWVLIQTFPTEVTQKMFRDANTTGLRLGAGVAVLFVAYIIVLIYLNKRQRRELLMEKSRELQSMERLFEILTQNTDDIFCLFSPVTYEADYVSANLERLLGVSQAEFKKDTRALHRVTVDNQITISPEIFDKIPKGGTWQTERQLRHFVTGEQHWYRETLYYVSIGDTDKYILVLSDRTKELQMNESLKRALDMAKSASEAKSQFLSNMSHDIRTPMNAIVGFSVLLAKDADYPEKVREYTRKITASSQHLLGLINDVLDMSKIESGKMNLNVSEFGVPELLEELSDIIMPQAKANDQTFEIHVKGKVHELLQGDKMRVHQILMNLLSNAVKYTQKGGTIKLTVEEQRPSSSRYMNLKFIVEDNGIGMNEEFIQQIFDPFVREDGYRTKSIQGTGLGMTIVKNLVDMMGGNITVQSEPDKGSIFTVSLEFPIQESSRDEHFWEKQGISRVLVVDDEEEICQSIQEIMADTGVRVNYATDGYRAVEMVKESLQEQREYHVILLDWKMPGMDGIETARRIRQEAGTSIPIMVLTAYDWSSIEEEAREVGITMFMPKPFFVSSFQSALERLNGKEDEISVPEDKDTKGEEESLEGLLFLIAEDNDINAEILTELLAMEGVRCERAMDGQEALEMFKNQGVGHYDMILMDIQMPVLNGYEATRAIRSCGQADAQSIPIIAMTANAYAEDVQAALRAGMNAHVAKPVNMELLKSVLVDLKNKIV